MDSTENGASGEKKRMTRPNVSVGNLSVTLYFIPSILGGGMHSNLVCFLETSLMVGNRQTVLESIYFHLEV